MSSHATLRSLWIHAAFLTLLFLGVCVEVDSVFAQDEEPPRPTPEGEDDSKDAARDDDLSSNEKKEQRDTIKALKKAIRNGDPDEIAQYVEALGMFGTERALDLILRAGERFSGDPVRTSVRNALLWSKHKGGVHYLRGELAKTKSQARGILIIETLSAFEGEKSAAPLLFVLENSKNPTLLVAALQGLRAKPYKAVVEALIRFYRTVQGTQDSLWAETRISLLALTNESYTVYEDWANWWEIQRHEWKPPGFTDERQALTAVYRPTRDLKLPKIFGNEIASKKVVFVIDTSKSMEKIDKTAREEGSKGGGISRMERAKRELIQVILELRDDVQFNIVSFNTVVTVWKDGKLVKATKSNKERAIKFIRSWQPNKYTNTQGALMRAFEVEDADTIFLLSDGSPTDLEEGEVIETDPIIEAVKKVNRFRRVTIHTLGFRGANVGFMKKLARDHHGTYSSIR
ncbi:MAG: VWA domain-containing protein [Planctomycetota bacterium]